MNNQRGLAPVIIVLIIVAFLAGGVLTWRYFAIPKEEMPEEKLPEGVTEEEKEKPEEVVKDETTNWKTYRNEQYGFEIKHPLDWQLDLRGISTLISLDVEKNNFLTEEEFKTRWGPYYDMRFVDDIKITVYASLNELPDNKEGLSLDEWIEKRMTDYLILKNSKKEIMINKYKGIEIEEIGITSYRSIFLIHNSFIYNFFIEKEQSPEVINTFNKMLSTFRFLE